MDWATSTHTHVEAALCCPFCSSAPHGRVREAASGVEWDAERRTVNGESRLPGELLLSFKKEMIRYRRLLLPRGGFSRPALTYTNMHEAATRRRLVTEPESSSAGKGAGRTEKHQNAEAVSTCQTFSSSPGVPPQIPEWNNAVRRRDNEPLCSASPRWSSCCG